MSIRNPQKYTSKEGTNIRIDIELKGWFKEYCASQNTTMSDMIERLIKSLYRKLSGTRWEDRNKSALDDGQEDANEEE